MNISSRPIVFATAVVLAAIGTVPLGAQRVLQTTTAQALQTASAVVVARVLNVNVRDEGWIHTYVDFQTLDTVKGAAAARFTTQMLGGRVGDAQVVSGTPLPHFVPGQEVVLFIQGTSDNYPILNRQHVYNVVTRGGVRYVSPAPTGLSVADARPGASAPASGPMRLADFISAVRAR